MFISHNFTIHDVGSGRNYLGGGVFGDGEDLCVEIGRGKMRKPDQTVKGHVGLFEQIDYWVD
ncbi:hypothetical protein [Paenibacillus sp. Aloe-11]|uniref:hypothetical protein n=1 Tax=Paenibacillus sp. Aloe-11 TaxID=1050222 RepID=UPI00024EFCA2|nr:hypothetical protein [Paenibacillus sp. Aloe-11]EHS57218.1 hypothetical protein WG8_3488 [Paenibacillus sp. Aloe-11]